MPGLDKPRLSKTEVKIDISTFNTLTQFSMLNITYGSNQSVTLQQIVSGSLNAGQFILASAGSSANDSAAFATETVAPLMPVGIMAPVEEAVGA